MSKEELIVLEEIKYGVTTESAKAQVVTYGDLPEFDPANGKTDETNALIIKTSKSLNKDSSSVEKLRKHFKEPSLIYGRAVDALAKEIQAVYEPAKIKWSQARKQIDDYEKEQEQKRANAEMDRVNLINEKINDLRMIPGSSIGMDSKRLEKFYNSVKVPDAIVFQERLEDAIEVYKDTMNKLETSIETTRKAEEAEKIQAENKKRQDEENAKIKAEQDAERETFLKEKAEFEAEKKALQDEKDSVAEEEAMKVAEQEAEALAIQQDQESQEQAIKTQKQLENNRKETLVDMSHFFGKGGLDGLLVAIENNEVRGLSYVR